MMKIKHLKTQRLHLRELRESDWKEVMYLRSDEAINKYIDRPKTSTQKAAISFIHKIQAGIQDKSIYDWSITLSNDDSMIGSICLWNISKDRKSAEIGYALSPVYQGKGFMSEAIKAVLQFGFETLEFENIDAYTHRANKKSIELLTKHDFIHQKGVVDTHNENNAVYRRFSK